MWARESMKEMLVLDRADRLTPSVLFCKRIEYECVSFFTSSNDALTSTDDYACVDALVVCTDAVKLAVTYMRKEDVERYVSRGDVQRHLPALRCYSSYARILLQ